ncbi:hypothetical protein [Enterobacter hormaechei]|uniref:hypothetical protein n=1 Tax=Enterobacter hormaechei TaxID=158836 RepID=UPI003D319972
MHSIFIPAFASQRQRWRGSGLMMHLNEKRPVKRAGEAGIALRARGGDRIYFTRLCASWWRAVMCGRLMGCWRGCAACAASGSL